MPILDVLCVGDLPKAVKKTGLAARLADAAARVFETGPQQTWVIFRSVPREAYSENAGGPPKGVQPILVTVLKRAIPKPRRLQREIQALTRAVASVCRRPAENIHLIYEPPGAGRVAFGGNLVTK